MLPLYVGILLLCPAGGMFSQLRVGIERYVAVEVDLFGLDNQIVANLFYREEYGAFIRLVIGAVEGQHELAAKVAEEHTVSAVAGEEVGLLDPVASDAAVVGQGAALGILPVDDR